MALVGAQTLDQDADWINALTWNQASGQPVNLTGFVANLWLMREQGVNAPLLGDFSAYVVLGGNQGTVSWDVPPTLFSSYKVGARYYWYLFVGLPGGAAYRLLEGPVLIN